MKNKSTWYFIQILALVVGSIIAWSTVIKNFINFYQVEGTLFKVMDCNFTNPVLTPCFWGAIAFIIALIWAVSLYTKRGQANQTKQQWWLFLLLIASTIFGWANVVYEEWQIILAHGGAVTGCSGTMTSITQSSCMYGSIMFLIAMVATWMIIKKTNR